MTTIFQTLLIIAMIGLFTVMFQASFRFNKGPLSMNNLIKHLQLLKVKFANHSPIDPDGERRIMEVLLNKIKTSCSREVITRNADLKELFLTNCQSVNGMKNLALVTTKTSWLKYSALMNDFNQLYFSVSPIGRPAHK